MSCISVTEVFRTQQYNTCIQIGDKRCRLGYFNGTDRYWSEQTALTVVYSVSSVQEKIQRFRLKIKLNISKHKANILT